MLACLFVDVLQLLSPEAEDKNAVCKLQVCASEHSVQLSPTLRLPRAFSFQILRMEACRLNKAVLEAVAQLTNVCL